MILLRCKPKTILFAILSAWLFSGYISFAAPYSGSVMLFTQPDRKFVSVKIWGDEYYHRVESMDGYPLIRNKKGWICYATINDNKSEWISTSVIYQGLTIDQ